METPCKIAVLGGDDRQIFMARALAEHNFSVSAWGLSMAQERLAPARVAKSWEEAIENADCVILPLPASSDGIRVHCPLYHGEEIPRITSLLAGIEGKTLLGGKLTPPVLQAAQQHGVRCVDYFDSEILQLKNALPTAEGAIGIAMKELPVTLDGSTVGVIGYGRIGALLSEKLTALGARVLVYARRSEQLTMAELHHQVPVPLTDHRGRRALESIPSECRALFNTVPAWILDKTALERIPPSCVIIDLASAPGGLDHQLAAQLGLRTVWATSLPGRCTPESAGQILAATIEELLTSVLSDRG